MSNVLREYFTFRFSKLSVIVHLFAIDKNSATEGNLVFSELRLYSSLLPTMPCHSDVVGSMMVLTSEILLAGKPPWVACSRINFSLGAM